MKKLQLVLALGLLIIISSGAFAADVVDFMTLEEKQVYYERLEDARATMLSGNTLTDEQVKILKGEGYLNNNELDDFGGPDNFGYEYIDNEEVLGPEYNWIDITEREAFVHAFTVCHFGSEEFLPETPFVLALIEFKEVDTLLLTRLLGVDPEYASLDWIGMQVTPRFLRNSKLKPTDVYFVPV